MRHVLAPWANNNTDLVPRAYRLLVDKNFSPALAMAIAADPLQCRRVLGPLTPGRVESRRGR